MNKDEIWKSYHIPTRPNYCRRPKNMVAISTSNGLEHELLKLKTCYELREMGINFITEAVPNDDKTKRIDIINLETGDRIEVEMTEKRAARFKGTDVIVIKGWMK